MLENLGPLMGLLKNFNMSNPMEMLSKIPQGNSSIMQLLPMLGNLMGGGTPNKEQPVKSSGDISLDIYNLFH